MQSVLKAYLKNYSDREIANIVQDLGSRLAGITPKRKATNLLGVEGSATQVYYSALQRMFKGELQFNGRNRQPPRDEVNALFDFWLRYVKTVFTRYKGKVKFWLTFNEVNALFSFCYVILGNEITMLLNGCGLDPYLGFYHGIQYGRASLSMDLLEPFRPVIDRFVLSLANLGIFKKADFEQREGGIYLTQSSMKRFFRHWQEFLTVSSGNHKSTRENIYLQIESLIKCLNQSGEFEPFLI